jgi:hypothetical protein
MGGDIPPATARAEMRMVLSANMSVCFRFERWWLKMNLIVHERRVRNAVSIYLSMSIDFPLIVMKRKSPSTITDTLWSFPRTDWEV